MERASLSGGGSREFRRAAELFGALVIVVGLFGTSEMAASGRMSATEARATARLVDIGGNRKLYLKCRGEGTPTVVLVSGGGGAHDEWTHVVDGTQSSPELRPSRSAVFPEVARFTRVCAYDRPGTARMNEEVSPSTPVPQPTTAQADVADLRALLQSGRLPGPYVLAGASWGGMIVNLFARTNPRSVAGLVLSDGASEFFKDALTPEQWNAWMHAIATSTPAGREAPDYESSVNQLRAAPSPPVAPAIVLTADKPWNLPLGDSGATWPAWLLAQDRLAALLHAEHVTETASSHGIAVESPRVVVDAIHDVVRMVRGDRTEPTSSTRN